MSHVGKQKMAWQKDELAAQNKDPGVAAYVAKGRLVLRTKRIWLVVSIVVFSLMMAIPGIYQAIRERKNVEGVQFMHLMRDMVLTPQERAHSIRRNLDSLALQLRQGSWSDSGAIAWDALAQATLQAWLNQKTVNRFVDLDSTQVSMASWNVLRATAFRYSDRIAMGDVVCKDSVSFLASLLEAQFKSWDVRAGLMANLYRVGKHCRYTLLSRDYLRAWEKQTEEASLLAQCTRPYLQILRYQAFGDLGNKGVAGDSAWTFYRPGIEYAVRPWVNDPRSRQVDYNDKPLLDDPIHAIVEFRDQLKERGVELIVMPVPNKETIYPDYLVGGMSSQHAGMVGHGLQALDSLRAHGIAVVDLFTAFRDERTHDKNLQDAIYLRDDTHWRMRGLQRAAKEVHKVLAQQSWFSAEHRTQEYHGQSFEVERAGDILTMTKLQIDFPSQTVACQQVYAMVRDSRGVVVDSNLYRDDFRNARILILGDSFSRIFQTDAPQSAGWISQLALLLQEPVASLVSDGGASTLVREKLARKPGALKGKSVVVWEFVERDYRFGDSGWKSMHWND